MVKSSQLYLGRLALSAIGWYQKGPCVNYNYMIKIGKLKITLKLCTRILKKFLKGRSHIIILGLRSRKIRELSRLPKNCGAYKRSFLLRLLTDKAL